MPDSAAAVAVLAALSRADLLRRFLTSDEFRIRVLTPLIRREPPAGGLFDAAPPDDLRAWGAGSLPLGEAGATAFAAGQSWAGLFLAVLVDEVFRDVVAVDLPVSSSGLRTALAELAARAGRRIEGAIDEVSEGEVRGWAVDASDPDRPVLLHLVVDGLFVSAGEPMRFRRDVQDRFGGSGLAGFAMPLPAHGGGRWAEVLVAGLGVSLGRTEIAPVPDAGLLAQLRGEVDRLRGALDALGRAVPAVSAAFTMPVERYADYAELYYGPLAHGPAGPPAATARRQAGLLLLVDLRDVAPAQGADLLGSLRAQSVAPDEVAVIRGGSDPSAVEDDLLRRLGWQSGCRPSIIRGEDPAASGWAEVLSDTRAERVVLVDGGAILAPDAIAVLDGALRRCPSTTMVYADEDRADPATGRRTDPILRPAFDDDLLRQVPYIGGAIAVRVAALREAAPALSERATAVAELALALHRRGLAIAHVPRILSTRIGPRADPAADRAGWRGVVEAALAEDEPAARVEPHRDALGAEVPGALTIRRPASVSGVTASVIIPTRDQPRLLAAALDSLRASRTSNVAAMRIGVVDNASALPETAELLARLAGEGVVVIRDEAPFNWAYLNNLAADQIPGDVLVFLNDDTLVIAPDWLDHLCEHAVRPDVGAVGARLAYEAGLIQHAGIVIRGPEAVPTHEGVGMPVASPGYLGRHALVRRVLAVTGACLATSRAVFERLGGFDSGTFPVEYNDVDYCLRANDAGLKVLYNPHAALYHLESMSRGFSIGGEKRAVAEAGTAALRRRWDHRFPHDPYFNAHFSRHARPFGFLRPPAPLEPDEPG